MRLNVNDTVKLVHDIPEHQLALGDTARLVEYVMHDEKGEPGYMLEIAQPSGAVLRVNVPESAVIPAEPPILLESKRFTVDASLIHHLGELLITDEVQALVELVKNAYDADATVVKVEINADLTYEGKSRPGYIVVDDNGEGMSEDTLERGWLTLSNSLKRLIKMQGGKTSQGRTPLGDKGLGRLSAQRLGRQIDIFTNPRNGTSGYHLSLRWDDFIAGTDLQAVPVVFERLAPSGNSGTRIVITGLNDLPRWKSLGTEDLRLRLATIVSPYQKVENFKLYCTLNGNYIDIGVLVDNLRAASQQRYHIRYTSNDKLLNVKGLIRAERLRALGGATPEFLEQFFDNDGGERFINYLLKKKGAFGLKSASDIGWYLESQFILNLGHLDDVAEINDKVADPGSFDSEVDAVAYESEEGGLHGALTNREFARFVRDISGIRVYRDGFALRVSKDWLGLGDAWTGGKSWYSLRPNNTMGYVAITAEHNPWLVETTNREDFVKTAHYQNFFTLMKRSVRYINDLQSFLGRNWKNYQRDCESEQSKTKHLTPSVAAQSLTNSFASVAQASKNALAAEQELLKVANAPDNIGVGELKASARSSLADVQNIRQSLENINQSKGLELVLSHEVDRLKDELAQVYELVSIGLTAEQLTHQIRDVIDRLNRSTKAAETHARKTGSLNERLEEYFLSVRGAARGLLRELSHLDPALKYVRESREVISIPDFMKEQKEYFDTRDESGRFLVRLEGRLTDAFTVWINRGKLLQIVDNLMLNSEYWLQHAIQTGLISEGVITIRAECPYLFVSDNGRGIDPSYEHILFEPFISSKKTGRGLGLYIVRQMLETEGCSIILTDTRNMQGRRCEFRIDFSKALK